MDLKPKALEKLQYFKGKVCSIITVAMNRNFEEKISREHFVTTVEDISIDGIWGSHPYNPQLFSFYFMNQIISIHEEAMLDPNNPEHAQMLSEFELRTGKKAESDLRSGKKVDDIKLPIINKSPSVPQDTDGDATFVDIENLEKLAEQCQKEYDNFDKFQSIKSKMLS